MALDLKSISARLDKLRGYLALLKEAQKMDLDTFKGDPKNYYTVERALQLAIERCHDIANHLISQLDMERPDKYETVFEILGKNGVVPAGFGKKLVSMARFRNLLVHEYMEIDLDRVYEILKTKLRDFEMFARHIVTFLEKAQP